MKYFKLTAEKKVNIFGIELFRIELTADCKWGKKGEKGGWIESENCPDGNARVSCNAKVYGNAQVYGDAWVYGDARVSGNAWVSGNAQVYGDAWVYGDAQVYGDARVSGDAQVSGDAWEKSPLQIQGRRHFVCTTKYFHLKIGCIEMSFGKWKEKFEEIGKQKSYTADEIKEYGLYIDLAISMYGLK